MERSLYELLRVGLNGLLTLSVLKCLYLLEAENKFNQLWYYDDIEEWILHVMMKDEGRTDMVYLMEPLDGTSSKKTKRENPCCGAAFQHLSI